jgi:GT2 family glycosyltransferase
MTAPLISLVVPCHNDGEGAQSVVAAIGRLDRPPAHALEAIVVDDASSDGSADLLEAHLPDWARLVRAHHNLGRASARNLGVANARGELLLLLDCDCLPARPDFLLQHHRALSAGADASVGDIAGDTRGFWGRYQSSAAKRRADSAHSGDSAHAMTTANMMLRTAVFRAVGGFDSRYRHYGFEDRDLLLRLQRSGMRLQHNPHAMASHAANLDLAGIAGKMQACGRFSAPLFRADHPQAYRSLGYAAVDASLHPLRGALLAPLARLVLSRTSSIESLLQRDGLPFGMRSALARLTTALAYLDGTRHLPDGQAGTPPSP